MGYELESPAPAALPDSDGDARQQVLERRWRVANERLAAVLIAYRALRSGADPEDPVWLAMQLRLAQARQRCREASDALELFVGESRLALEGR